MSHELELRVGVVKWGREWESRNGVMKRSRENKKLGAYVMGITKGVIN